MQGTMEDMTLLYLDEFMWRERYGKNISEVFYNILHHIADRRGRAQQMKEEGKEGTKDGHRQRSSKITQRLFLEPSKYF
ncbi:UNVERIFIED_CONTAM: hypothetical protein FKN15_041130 [Acipenser sinensis]